MTITELASELAFNYQLYEEFILLLHWAKLSVTIHQVMDCKVFSIENDYFFENPDVYRTVYLGRLKILSGQVLLFPIGYGGCGTLKYHADEINLVKYNLSEPDLHKRILQFFKVSEERIKSALEFYECRNNLARGSADETKIVATLV